MNKVYVPVDEYENRKKKYQKLFDKNKKKLNNISWLRFFVFLTLCFSIYKAAADSLNYGWLTCIIVLLFIFIILIIKYGNIKKEIKLYSDLISINAGSIKRVSGEWNSFPDDGAEFKNYDHRFSFDLDIFGTGSLFQWINVTNTPYGRIKLKEILSNRKVNLVYAVGPVPMMRAVSQLTKVHKIKTLVSLNPIMVDATGMCGACRVNVGGQTKFGCVDGPEFDGHSVDFDQLEKRLKLFSEQEKKAMETIKER